MSGLNVTILGSGSLGSVYAAWAADSGNSVTVVARQDHVDAINANGLTLNNADGSSSHRRMLATTDASSILECDIVCVGCKAPDTEKLLSDFKLSPRAAFSIQNGVGQTKSLAQRFGSAAVCCISMVGGTLRSPGNVDNTFSGTTYLGNLSTTDPLSTALVAEQFGIPETAVRSDIESVLWSKAVLAVAAMGTTSLTRLNYHSIFELPGTREAFLDLALEASSIATAEGFNLVDLPGPLKVGHLVSLPRVDALQYLASLADNMIAAGQTSIKVSMLQSIERKRPIEVDAIFSDTLELANHHKLEVPKMRFVTHLLESIDTHIKENLQ